MSQFYGAEHQFDNIKTTIANTSAARKQAVLAAKWADKDGDGKIDPEEARRAERILEQHQTRMMYLLQLMREKVRQYTGMGGVNDLRKLFSKFDTDQSKSISWEEFDHALSTMGIHMEQAELTYLMRLFDKDGDGTVDYEEFCKWINSSTNMDAEKVAETIFGALDNPVPNRGKSGPSDTYKKMWLAQHQQEMDAANEEKDLKERVAAANAAAQKTRMYSSALHTGINNEFESSAKINTGIKKDREAAVYGQEKKVKDAAKAQALLSTRIVNLLRSSIQEKTGQTDPSEQLEELWKIFDVNNDGTISWKEFCTGMKELGIKVSDRELMQVIAEFDTNGDGGLDYYEFMDKIAPKPKVVEGSTEDTFNRTVSWQRRKLAADARKPPVIEPLPAAQGKLKGGHTWAKLPDRAL